MSEQSIAILGGLITFLLSVNLYYFKDIAKRLSTIELEIVKLSTNNITVLKVLDHHDKEIDSLRDKIHKLEGSVNTVVEHIRLNEK